MADLVLLAELTWEEARRYGAEEAVALVPTGSIEQHGPHLPLKVDTELVNTIAQRAAEQARDGRVVVTPPLWLGVSTHHVDFFALTIDSLTYIELITQLAMSLIHSGFTRILFLNGHGGNTDPLRVAVKRVREITPEPVVVATVNYWNLASEELARHRESERGGISHAGELETSMMMHLHPGAVQSDRLEKQIPKWQPPYVIQDLLEPGIVTLGTKWTELTRTGVIGDPTVANAEKGQKLLEEAARATAKLLDAMLEWQSRNGALHLG